jgi:S1-C subfamily serine protease
MKTYSFLIILFLSAQIQFTQVKSESNEVFNLPEVGALIVQFKNTFKVQFVAPENVRQDQYKKIDLRKDDIILLINGKHINKFDELKSAYDKLKIGQEFKLGIKRNKQSLAVDIMKADPKSLPQKKSFVSLGQHSENKFLLAGIGLLIINVNEKPMINKMANNDQVKQAGLSEGDVLTELNGIQIKSYSQFKNTWESLGNGRDVTIRFNKTKSVSFKKQNNVINAN